MEKYTSMERLLRTFEGKETDRVAIYDIIHNRNLIEFATGTKITPKNAEDLMCATAGKYLDLVRHFTVPDYEGVKIVKEDDGFTYKYEWWTGHILEKPPINNVEDVVRLVESDIENIEKCTAEGRICSRINNHVNLFYEKFKYFEEVRQEYKRLSEKLGDTVMLGPEMCQGVSVALYRYGIDWWTYLYHDYPQTAMKFIDTCYDYEIKFIEAYADMKEMPFVCSAGSTGLNDRLLFPYNFFKDVIIPKEKKVVEAFKKHGKYIIYFLDGYKLPILQDFIEAGADAIDPFEPYCAMDVAAFRQAYPETVICQPIDCTQLLPYGTQEQVSKAVIKAIEDAGKRKILIGSTSEIHPETNFKNAVVMYETVKNYSL